MTAQKFLACSKQVFRIQLAVMRDTQRAALGLILLVTLFAIGLFAATPGWFRGTVVETDESPATPGWIYVRGRDGGIRRVDISQAKVTYSDEVTSGKQPGDPRSQLISGAEVRVNAEQGSDGEWRARSVEILHVAGGHGGTTRSKACAHAYNLNSLKT